MAFDPNGTLVAEGEGGFDPGGELAVVERPRFDPSGALEAVGERRRFDPSGELKVVEAEPTVSQRAVVTAPGVAGPQLGRGVLGAGATQAFDVGAQVKERALLDEAARPGPKGLPSVEEALKSGVRQEPERQPEPIEVPRFGEPGTVARGASDTLAGLAEWALNKPEEALATFTLVEPAVLARYGPEIVKQFVGDVKAGLGGDREAIGRALTMGALVGGPRVFKAARDKYLAEGPAKGPVADVDLAAVEALRPKSPVEAATGVETRNVLPGAAEVFERVVVEPAVKEVERPVTKGVVEITKEGEKGQDASKVSEAAEVHGDVLRVGEEARGAQERVPVEEGGERVRPQEEVTIEEAAGVPGEAVPERGVDFVADEPGPHLKRQSIKEYRAEIAKIKAEAPEPTFESIIPAEDTHIGKNAAGEDLYLRSNGQVYRMRFDSPKTRPNGYPDHGGDLAPVEGAPITESGPGLVGLGGATPSEFTPASGRMTGIKNASIDLQRQERGLEPVMKPLREEWGEAWDRAMAKMDADYTTPERLGVQDRLIEELRQRPRAATPEEDVMLLQRMADYRNELDRAQAAVKLAEKDGRELDAEAGRARADEWHARLGELETITELSGTYSGRSLAARKMIVGADYTLERMERQFKKAGGEEPFTKEQREGVAKDQAQIEAFKKQLEEKERLLAEETAARVRAELNVKKDGTASVPEHIMRIVRKVGEVLDKRAQAARVRLRGKLFTLSPELLKDLAEVGAANIYHVGVDTAVWGARMVEELGERVRPHLDTIFEAAKKLVDEAAVEVAGRKPRQARAAAAASMTAKDPEARRLEQWKKRTVDAIVKLEERMEKGDFSKRTRREVQLDEEARKLAFELHEAKRKWNQKVFERQLEAEGPGAKAVRRLGEASNTARSVLGSVDLSAVLRQGKFAVLAHPVLGARAIGPMLKALLSEKKAFEIEREIAERPNAQRYKRAGLALTEADYTLSKMEEQFMGRWAMDPLHFARNVAPRAAEAVRKLNPVAASARAYQVFLNKLRADVFDTLVEGLERKGGDIAAQDKVIANAVNVFTGRGSLGKGEQAAQALNTWFWAPKFVASRFQALLGQPLWRGKWKDTGAARAVVAREYAKILSAYALLYSLASASGVKIGTQMDGTDWGKWIFGKTRLDPLAGVGQASVFLTRVIKGTTTTLAGKRKNLRGQRRYGDKDVPGVMLDFGRSKLAPLPGGIVDALAGEDFLHRPVTPKSVLLRYTVPISLQDIASTMKEQGVPAGTAFTLLSIMGEGVATYDDFEKRK